ncbi:LPXTG cell wall anchor domain-containing protein, partial [Streptococcus infantis]|uniref:LPXTG cell wall anchor domain-containing protein n=1 Tax=Streptococcus infantis TaxID=68892 RepID=UPI0039C07629
EPKTTSSTTTTTEEPKTTSSTTTTTEEPKTTSSTTTTTEEPKSTVTTTKDKPGLPKTGENKGTFVTILGTLILVSSILVVRNSLKSKNN